MEDLMYFVWQQRLCHLWATSEGVSLDVVHPGVRNLDSGPDFFNAKLRIGGVVWAGNVEMHYRASDWFRHHHDSDPAYDSVILHVVMQHDADVFRTDGTPISVAVMTIPDDVMQRYDTLVGAAPVHSPSAPLLPGQTPAYSSLSCAHRLSEVPPLVLHDWVTALCTQRMIGKMQRLMQMGSQRLAPWPDAFYVVLTRSLGTGVNSDAMERLAHILPLSSLLHHRDNLLQLEAMLLGQSGLLQSQLPVQRPADEQQRWQLLQREYAFLQQKFSLTPMPSSLWRLGRIRPAAHPVNRLRALAQLLHQRRDIFSLVLEAKNIDELQRLLTVPGLGRQTVRSLIINAVVPALLGYAQWQGNEELSERALALLESLPPEDNRYITQWRDAGVEVRSALDSQALLHLFLGYCQPHKCLQCRLGCWLMKPH